MLSPRRSQPARSAAGARVLSGVLAVAVMVAAAAPLVPTGIARGAGENRPDHLVVSEVVTGGASASDELIELHNPTAAPLPLEGLEVVYVTATGATISRRAAWSLGAPSVPAGGHVLVANEAGIYASAADATYASGMAATGGSVALRIQGASTAVDAAGWGTAASAWLEGAPAPAPAAGSSIERLPGGAEGSWQDGDDNAADFVQRAVPEPQNLLSDPTPEPPAAPTPTPIASPTPPAPPSAEPTPVPSAPLTVSPSAVATPPASTPLPTPTPTPTPPPTPTLQPSPTTTEAQSVSIAAARGLPDGTIVTIEAVAITASDFHDGGGFVADGSGGIAVITEGTSFQTGQLLRLTGELDDRFAQRTLRVDAADVVGLGMGAGPTPTAAATGAIGEGLEGRLVRVAATLTGSPTQLSAGLAFDIDDGSGPARLVVGSATGITTGGWVSGMTLELVGVVGQRDSTGTGLDGYRILPRDPADVAAVGPGPTPPPSASPDGGSPTPTPAPGSDGVVSIAAARQSEPGTAIRVRGVVTLQSGLVDRRTAVIQDASGAILLRFGEEAGSVSLGALIEVVGSRSTLSGMESVRVSQGPSILGSDAEPNALQVRTGEAGEAREAQLVLARGAIVASARRSSSGTVSFDIDDGSGPLRVSAAGGLRLERDQLTAGTWVEVRGVLGQQTTRAKPTEGYRIWPRRADDLRVVAPSTGGDGSGEPGDGSGGGGDGGEGGGPAGALDGLDSPDLANLRIGATLVVGRWRELGLGGVLWDGTRLVTIHAASGDAVARLTRNRRPPIAVELAALTLAGTDAQTGASSVRLGTVAVLADPPAPPRSTVDGPLPAWVSVVGRLGGSASRPTLRVGDAVLALDPRCARDDDRDDDRHDDDDDRRRQRLVSVTGIAAGAPLRLFVPCHGIRPAPSVAVARSAQPTATADVPRHAPVVTTSAGMPASRGPVAGLLVAAAVALVGGAALRRRLASGDPTPGAEAPPAVAHPEPSVGPPRLTLVRLPHEHGP